MYEWQLDHDFNDILKSSKNSLRKLEQSKILLTGCTGFVGAWILNSLNEACLKYNIKISLYILTRNKTKNDIKNIFISGLSDDLDLQVIVDDIRQFKVDVSFDYVIHGAVDASADLNSDNPNKMFDTIVSGTSNLLKVLSYSSNIKKILHLSTGAVYGMQTYNEPLLESSFSNEPILDNFSTYAESKRISESLINSFTQQNNLQSVHARMFAISGPFMKFTSHFAFGNFINDALTKKIITIKSDGSSIRSFLYAADMTKWLIYLLVENNKHKAYNIGSSVEISIKDLAHKIADILDCDYEIQGKSMRMWDNKYYVPSNKRLISESKIIPTVDLDTMIKNTIIWKNDENKAV